MSNALARVYALQQRELNARERQRQQQIAKKQRLIAAFNASGLLTVFEEFRNLPLRAEVRQRVYKTTVGSLTWHESVPADQLDSMSFNSINGSSYSPRWWCEEDPDSGNMRYGYSSGMSSQHDAFFPTPQGEWLDRFIEYMAAAADPEAIARKMQQEAETAQAPPARRQVQPV